MGAFRCPAPRPVALASGSAFFPFRALHFDIDEVVVRAAQALFSRGPGGFDLPRRTAHLVVCPVGNAALRRPRSILADKISQVSSIDQSIRETVSLTIVYFTQARYSRAVKRTVPGGAGSVAGHDTILRYKFRRRPIYC